MRCFAPRCMCFLALCLLPMSESLAETILCNVAAFQATDGSIVTANKPPLVGVDESHWSNNNTYAPADPNSYWKVDLGQEFDVEYLAISTGVGADQLNGATLQAFDSTNTLVNSFVLSGYTSANETINWDNGGAGWAGVQTFQIGGDGLGVANLSITEFEAYAYTDCTVYGNFIDGITTTVGSSTGVNISWPASHDESSIDYLTNGDAITDNYGLINSPTAEGYCTTGGFWYGNGSANATNHPILTFDLGESYDLEEMVVWNMNQVTTATNNFFNRGFKDVIVRTSEDGVNWVEIADANGADDGNYTIAMVDASNHLGDSAGPQATIDLSGITANYVQIEALSSHGSAAYWGLNEVRLYGEVVPEPSTIILLLGSLISLAILRPKK